MKLFHRTKIGFTMIELLIVIGIIVIVLVGVFISNNAFKARNAIETAARDVEQVFQEARALSLSGQSYPDFNDYDGDGDTTELVVPFSYIATIEYQSLVSGIFSENIAYAQDPYDRPDEPPEETPEEPPAETPQEPVDLAPLSLKKGYVYLWADLKGGLQGELDQNDILISESKLTDKINLSVSQIDSQGNSVPIEDFTSFAIIYKTPDGNIDVPDFPPDTSIEFTLQIEDEANNVLRSRYLYVNSQSGIPEAGTRSIMDREEYVEYQPETGDAQVDGNLFDATLNPDVQQDLIYQSPSLPSLQEPSLTIDPDSITRSDTIPVGDRDNL